MSRCVELSEMRKERFDRLLAGTVLALIAATPTMVFAQPDRV